MYVNVLTIAGNFFQFIKVLERFQVVYGTFWIELFLGYHRTFEIFLIGKVELVYESRFWWVPSPVMSTMIQKDL